MANKDKKDCFAYVETTGLCSALKCKNCEGCNFYKHSDDPVRTRSKIKSDIEIYSMYR